MNKGISSINKLSHKFVFRWIKCYNTGGLYNTSL